MFVFVSQPPSHRTPHSSWSRPDSAAVLQQAQAALPHMSQWAFAQAAEVPRFTFRYWQPRKEAIADDPNVRDFLESPKGTSFIHVIRFRKFFARREEFPEA